MTESKRDALIQIKDLAETYYGELGEIWDEVRDIAVSALSNTSVLADDEDPAHALLHAIPRSSTKPQKWIKCSDRLPTRGDSDWLGGVYGISSLGEVERLEWTDVESCAYDVTHWMPTGLRRPAPPEHKPE